jgi:uncharacterized protein (TIGR02270 family)
VIRALVEDCARGAAFVWLLRDAATRAPHYDLAALAAADERLESYLDALRVARRPGWTLAAKAMAEDAAGPGEVFVAATLAFGGGDEGRGEAVLAAALAAEDRPRAVAAALGWIPWAKAAPWSERCLASADAIVARIGLAAAAAHRRDPGPALASALGRGDLALRRRALRAAGELGRVDLLGEVREALKDEDLDCRFEAGWSACLLGAAGAEATLRALVKEGHPAAEQACAMAARRLGARSLSEARAYLLGLANRRVAVKGAGALGDPALLPWLLDVMENPSLRRVAGEAFVMISGAKAEGALVSPRPAEWRSGPSDDPADDDVAPDPDEALPWLVPEAARAWLDRRAGAFDPEKRYLLGQPIAAPWLGEALRRGTQRQRAAAAVELALASAGAPLFEVRAPALRQIAALAKQARSAA